jgi:hypothetical protein
LEAKWDAHKDCWVEKAVQHLLLQALASLPAVTLVILQEPAMGSLHGIAFLWQIHAMISLVH